MNPEEIKTLGINSAQIYYAYLSGQGQGVVTINVISISRNGRIFKLTLDRKIHNLEIIEFKVLGALIDSDKINVIEYDRENYVLTIRPIQELQEQFEELREDDITIISDLKFLIRRVEDWYEQHGNEIKIPSPDFSLRLNAPTEEDFFPGLIPSDDQKLGIEAIFKSPLSYIWGAPGTGKTQLVLAYSLIHYIRSGKKVAIFAATNNALEQILYGVLKMTKEAGIEDYKVLRLGTPSSKFAQEHPDSCESMGLQRKIKEINNQIELVKKGIEHKKLLKILNTIKYESQEIFFQIEEAHTQKGVVLLSIELMKKDILDTEFMLDKLQLQILRLTKSIQQKEKIKSSFSYRLKKIFTKNIDLEIELKKERIKLYESKEKNNTKKEELEMLRRRCNESEVKYRDSSKIEKLIKDLQSICANSERLREIVSNITLQNYQNIKDNLEAYIQERNESLIMEEYVELTEQELLEKLQNLEFEKNNFESDSAESIKNANVIALTLDCYIGRYKDKELPVEHYFLDEAGYASLIKALTLFRRDIPITLLGDHMQLPPVCEMNEQYMIDENQDVFMWAQSSLYAEWIFTKDREDAFSDYATRSDYAFNKTNKIDLLHTYRFGTVLACTLDKFVYKNGFAAHDEIGETKIYYVDAPRILMPDRENQSEALKIHELLSSLSEDSFAILTPYRNQVGLIGNELPEARHNQKIMTIHKSQGREWDDVVLSIVDTNNMWLVDSSTPRGRNILNTAVSRTRKRLFIVCDYNFWIRQEGQLVKGLLDVATAV